MYYKTYKYYPDIPRYSIARSESLATCISLVKTNIKRTMERGNTDFCIYTYSVVSEDNKTQRYFDNTGRAVTKEELATIQILLGYGSDSILK